MKSLLASVRANGGLDRVDHAVQRLEDEWRKHGEVPLDRLWAEQKGLNDPEAGDPIVMLAELVRTDLRCRFARGQTPTVSGYLERFPELEDADSRVLSLIYEEFCLVEERGGRVDVDAISGRYPRWKESLVSQLQYHHLFSQAAGVRPKPTPFPDAGDTFEEFQLVSLLGRGGTSRVFLARDLSLGGKQVVLKVSLDRGREPQAQGALDHPHIVPVNSVVFGDEGMRGLSMPYRAGLPLDEVIRRVNPASNPARAMALWEALMRPAEPTVEPAPKPDTTASPGSRRRRSEGRWVGGLSGTGELFSGGRLGGQGHRRGPALCPRAADVPPRRQAGERPADRPARPAAPRLQPGRVAPFRIPGPGRDARGYAPLHGPRTDRGVPQSRSMGQGRSPGRHLFPRAGPARAAHGPGPRSAGRDPLARPRDACAARPPADARRVGPPVQSGDPLRARGDRRQVPGGPARGSVSRRRGPGQGPRLLPATQAPGSGGQPLPSRAFRELGGAQSPPAGRRRGLPGDRPGMRPRRDGHRALEGPPPTVGPDRTDSRAGLRGGSTKSDRRVAEKHGSSTTARPRGRSPSNPASRGCTSA